MLPFFLPTIPRLLSKYLNHTLDVWPIFIPIKHFQMHLLILNLQQLIDKTSHTSFSIFLALPANLEDARLLAYQTHAPRRVI